jgi:hypothetical protein
MVEIELSGLVRHCLGRLLLDIETLDEKLRRGRRSAIDRASVWIGASRQMMLA